MDEHERAPEHEHAPEHERAIVDAVERLIGTQVITQRAVSGGYTYAANRVAALADGRSVFVKAAVDARTREWLRAEQRVYASVVGDFLPACYGWEDGAATVLVLEDLSTAQWPPPWSAPAVRSVLETLAEVHASPAPADLPRPDEIDGLRDGWSQVVDDPAPLLATGICSQEWLVEALPTLLAAAQRAPLDGDRLVHLDVRSDNLCLRDGRCLLFDWSSAARGNPLLDVVLWLPSLRLEGGPAPDELTEPGMTELAAVFTGYLAARAGLPEPPSVPPPGVRALQRAQLEIALPWAARCLGLPVPE